MASLEMGAIRNSPPPDEDGQEFNAYTLTGELTELFLGLVRFVEEEDASKPLTMDQLLSRLRSHIHRGVAALAVRVKSLPDVVMIGSV